MLLNPTIFPLFLQRPNAVFLSQSRCSRYAIYDPPPPEQIVNSPSPDAVPFWLYVSGRLKDCSAKHPTVFPEKYRCPLGRCLIFSTPLTK